MEYWVRPALLTYSRREETLFSSEPVFFFSFSFLSTNNRQQALIQQKYKQEYCTNNEQNWAWITNKIYSLFWYYLLIYLAI